MRFGSLPFPGVFSLYEAADPADLGEHCSGSTLARFGRPGEQERGTLYTRRAGFIDLCHVRETIDWTRFLHRRIHPALQAMDQGSADEARSQFTYHDAKFEISVCMPDNWLALPIAERHRIIDEISIVFAQRLSVAITTWHEIVTWYGHQTVPGVSERGSAFTWDDTTSHVVGAWVGGLALRDKSHRWDRAVTLALNDYLQELEVTNRVELREAEQLVRDRWWKGPYAIRRDLDTGLAQSFKQPWLPPDRSGPALALATPDPEIAGPIDWADMVTLTITPPAWIMRKLWLEQSPPHPIEGEAGLAEAVERVRLDMGRELGPGFDRR
jgi:hypothetical protein